MFSFKNNLKIYQKKKEEEENINNKKLKEKKINKYIQYKNHEVIQNIKNSLYFKSNIVYMIYSIGMILIGQCGWGLNTQNLNYLIFGVVHLINATMYIFVWIDVERDIFTFFVLADWLNVFGALLYLITAILYPYEYKSDDDGADYAIEFYIVRYLELIASIVEVIAAFGWNYQWFILYYEDYCKSRSTTIGRGFTFDDPDLWANITIDIGAIYYLYYNVSLFVNHFDNYDTNFVYETGDIYYFINSVIYTIAALRDCGAFWYLPTAGIWPDYPPIKLQVVEDNSFDDLEHNTDINDIDNNNNDGNNSYNGNNDSNENYKVSNKNIQGFIPPLYQVEEDHKKILDETNDELS